MLGFAWFELFGGTKSNLNFRNAKRHFKKLAKNPEGAK